MRKYKALQELNLMASEAQTAKLITSLSITKKTITHYPSAHYPLPGSGKIEMRPMRFIPTTVIT
jgi:hypothetical protein